MTRPNGQQAQILHSHASFQDFDVFAGTVRGWDLDWQQLDRGPLEARVQQIVTPAVLLSRVDFNRRYHQRGATPTGYLTFGILRAGAEEINWCGQRAGAENLLVFRSGGEYESLSPPGFGGYTVSIAEELFRRQAQHLVLPVSRFLGSGGNEVLACDPERLSALRSQLRAICDRALADPSMVTPSGFRDQIETTLAGELLEVLADGQELEIAVTSAVRSRAARRALFLIREQPREPRSVLDLCRAAEVSERTLRYAFREFAGVTPKQYLQAVRLNAVRRELQRSEPGVKVADIANRWGFWHLGQFAADYRRQFGELPSETLSRG